MIRTLLLSAALTLVLCAHAAAAARTVVDLQPQTSSTSLHTSIGNRRGFARLTQLNTEFNIWFLLDVSWPGERGRVTFHLENPAPERYRYALDASYMAGLLISEGSTVHRCDLWGSAASALRKAPTSNKTFVPLCDNRILVRNATEGQETTREFVVGFLRDYVWGGEKITGLVKDYVYKDKYLITAETNQASEHPPTPADAARSRTGPRAARVNPDYLGATLEAKELGIELADAPPARMNVGQWYPTRASEHIFLSIIQPKLVDPAIFKTYRERVKKLDAIEASALVFLLAFELDAFELGFTLGTRHPAVGWSHRAPDALKYSDQPGPDGIDSYQPLVMVGKVNPVEAPRVVATFTGGFKRSHGAFKWGRLSRINQASHYGFRVNGVTFSTLHPELSTFLIYRDGTVQLKTWTPEDNAQLPNILHARQNGLPLIEWDPESGRGIPGGYVGDWGMGNWSATAQREQRALRAAACLQEADGVSFLIYGYFSAGTPNAMARVFQAYHCRYAMHLDMNALEHTYLAVYLNAGKQFQIQHLNTGMHVLDKTEKSTDTIVPRFLGTADNRDFFYVMAKD